jgi:hypothetical protein
MSNPSKLLDRLDRSIEGIERSDGMLFESPDMRG